jgi:flagellar assembly factor FliW
LGKIDYTDNDIFYFNEGLVGFPNKSDLEVVFNKGFSSSDLEGLEE